MESGIGILSDLRSKMKWHEARQGVLSQNIANAETPDYLGHDLKAFKVEDMKSSTSVAALRTHQNHLSGSGSPGAAFEAQKLAGFEVTPEGNGVVLEDQMAKITTNQIEYQAATTLYTRSLGLLRTAVGSR